MEKQTAMTEGQIKIGILKDREQALIGLINAYEESLDNFKENKIMFFETALKITNFTEQLLATQQILAEWEFRIWNYNHYSEAISKEANENFEVVFNNFKKIIHIDSKYIFWSSYANTQEVRENQNAKNQIYLLMKEAVSRAGSKQN